MSSLLFLIHSVHDIVYFEPRKTCRSHVGKGVRFSSSLPFPVCCIPQPLDASYTIPTWLLPRRHGNCYPFSDIRVASSAVFLDSKCEKEGPTSSITTEILFRISQPVSMQCSTSTETLDSFHYIDNHSTILRIYDTLLEDFGMLFDGHHSAPAAWSSVLWMR